MEDLRIVSSTGPQPGKVKCQLHRDLEHVNSQLFLDIQKWLKLRAKTCRPKLTDEQKAQLRTCFDLMDADGSGAIDAEELSEAFELLGMNYSRAEIQELLDDVDRDGSGECEYPEFVEIMTISLSRIREEQEKSGEKQGPDISFDLMATAYRRKRLMEGLMSGDRDVQETVVQNQILVMATNQLAAQEPGASERTRTANKDPGNVGTEPLMGGAQLGASEHAVIRSLARRLQSDPKYGERTWQDLEQLARFGMTGMQKLRKPTAESVIAQVLPHVNHTPLQLPTSRQVSKIQQCLHKIIQNPVQAPNATVQPAKYILCKHKPKIRVKPSNVWSPGLMAHRGSIAAAPSARVAIIRP